MRPYIGKVIYWGCKIIFDGPRTRGGVKIHVKTVLYYIFMMSPLEYEFSFFELKIRLAAKNH